MCTYTLCVNGYLRLLVSLRGDSYAVIAQTITAIINRSCKTSEKPTHLLSKVRLYMSTDFVAIYVAINYYAYSTNPQYIHMQETLSNKTYIIGLYNQGNNHWILIVSIQ